MFAVYVQVASVLHAVQRLNRPLQTTSDTLVRHKHLILGGSSGTHQFDFLSKSLIHSSRLPLLLLISLQTLLFTQEGSAYPVSPVYAESPESRTTASPVYVTVWRNLNLSWHILVDYSGILAHALI
jgi:hypothetical protein